MGPIPSESVARDLVGNCGDEKTDTCDDENDIHHGFISDERDRPTNRQGGVKIPEVMRRNFIRTPYRNAWPNAPKGVGRCQSAARNSAGNHNEVGNQCQHQRDRERETRLKAKFGGARWIIIRSEPLGLARNAP
jgi:hypothetical protein